MKKEEMTYGGVYLNKSGKVTAYFGGATENGFVFRNDKAKGDEICYIPELSFDECSEDCTMTKEEAAQYGYTFNQLMRLVSDELKYDNINVSDNRLDEIARNVLGELDWLCPETYLKSVDLLAELFA